MSFPPCSFWLREWDNNKISTASSGFNFDYGDELPAFEDNDGMDTPMKHEDGGNGNANLPHQHQPQIQNPTQHQTNIKPPKSLDRFYFTFGQSNEPNVFGGRDRSLENKMIDSMTAYIKWEDAKFAIEKRYKFFQQLQQKRTNKSLVVGYLWQPNMNNWREDASLLPGHYVIQPNDCVILVRRPFSEEEIAALPARYTTELQRMKQLHMSAEDKSRIHLKEMLNNHQKNFHFNETMTEEEKMTLITDHASKTVIPRQEKVPPPTYTCFLCHGKGHWKQNCPNVQRMPSTHRRSTGIPKKLLRVMNDNSAGKTLMDDHGQFVMPVVAEHLFRTHKHDVEVDDDGNIE